MAKTTEKLTGCIDYVKLGELGESVKSLFCKIIIEAIKAKYSGLVKQLKLFFKMPLGKIRGKMNLSLLGKLSMKYLL